MNALHPKNLSFMFKKPIRDDEQKLPNDSRSRSGSYQHQRRRAIGKTVNSLPPKNLNATLPRFSFSARQSGNRFRKNESMPAARTCSMERRNSRRNERFSAPDLFTKSDLSKKNEIGSQKSRKFSCYDSNKSQKETDRTRRTYEKSTKKVKDLRNYVNKSCSPASFLDDDERGPISATFKNASEENQVSTPKRIEGNKDNMLEPPQNRTNEERVEEGNKAGPLVLSNEKTDVALCTPLTEGSQLRKSSRIKTCKNCGMQFTVRTRTTPNGNIDAVTEHLVQSVISKYPHFTDIADSVKSLIRVPTPIIEILKNKIGPAIQKSSPNKQNMKVQSVESYKRVSSTDVKPSISASQFMSEVGRFAPIGLLRKVSSPKNPKANSHLRPEIPIAPPKDDWISPLPHTPGYRQARRPFSSMGSGTPCPDPNVTSLKPRANPPPDDFCCNPNSSPKPQRVEPPTDACCDPSTSPEPRTKVAVKEDISTTPTLRLRSHSSSKPTNDVPLKKDAPNKCVEWYKKITGSKSKSGTTSKCLEWYEKITSKNVNECGRSTSGDKCKEPPCNTDSNLRNSPRPVWDTKKKEEYQRRKSLEILSPNRSYSENSMIPKISRSSRQEFTESAASKNLQLRKFSPDITKSTRRSSQRPPFTNTSTALTTTERPTMTRLTTIPMTKKVSKPSISTKRPEGRGNIHTSTRRSRFRFGPKVTPKSKQQDFEPTSGRGYSTTERALTKAPFRGGSPQSSSTTSSSRVSASSPSLLRKTRPSGFSGGRRRSNAQRVMRDQIRIFKAKNRGGHPLNPFMWFKRPNNDFLTKSQAIVVRDSMLPVRVGRFHQSTNPIVTYDDSSTSSLSELSTISTHIPVSPSISLTASTAHIHEASPEYKPRKLPKRVMFKDLTVSERRRPIDWRMTRAQMFRNQFIQQKLQAVTFGDDSWWKNFNSKSLPAFKETSDE